METKVPDSLIDEHCQECERVWRERAGSQVVYLLWSGKRQAWWAPDARGYTDRQDLAGRYSEADAIRHVVRSAQCGQLDEVTSMVAAPDNWSVAP